MGYIIGEAIQLGIWNNDEASFEKFGWVPDINTPVYIADNIEGVSVSEGEYKIGEIPNSNYPVIINKTDAISQRFALNQNYPNPFNPKTVISYQLPEAREVELSIYNILGQKVITLVSEKQAVGSYRIEWDATDFTSGVYLYRLETDKGIIQIKKLILLK